MATNTKLAAQIQGFAALAELIWGIVSPALPPTYQAIGAEVVALGGPIVASVSGDVAAGSTTCATMSNALHAAAAIVATAANAPSGPTAPKPSSN